MKSLYKKITIFILLATLFSNCGEDSLNSAQTTIKDVDKIKTIENLSQVMHGALDRINAINYYGRNYIIYGESYADNTFANGNSGQFIDFSNSELIKNSVLIQGTWQRAYQVISSANLILAAKINYKKDEEGRYKHLLGEAYFFRALAHFDALRYFGQQNVNAGELDALGIPYEKIFHPEGEGLLPKRSSVREVKDFLYQDLAESLRLMDPKYDYNTLAYVNSDATKALFIRVALYFKDYDKVIELAKPLITSNKYELQEKEAYVKGWAAESSSNWILALNNNPSDNPGIDGLSHIYQNTGYGDIVAYPVVKSLFAETDIRGLSSMIRKENGYRNYGKYPLNNPPIYQNPIFRIEEVILSYAEALYFKGDITNSLIEFNKINSHRGSAKVTTLSDDIILEQWRREFYFEGFRFHTLARFKKAILVKNEEGKVLKYIPYGDYKFAFPIPQAEINRSGLKQNKGY